MNRSPHDDSPAQAPELPEPAGTTDGADPDQNTRPSAAQLSDFGLFGGISRNILEVLANKLPVVQGTKGETIVHEGEPAHELYVVLEGDLEVTKAIGTAAGVTARVVDTAPPPRQLGPDGSAARSSERQVLMARLKTGDWFGEMALIDVQTRSTTVRCVTRCALMRISATDLQQLLYRHDLKSYTLFMMNIARELSRRLRVADHLISSLGPEAREAYATAQSQVHSYHPTSPRHPDSAGPHKAPSSE